MKRLFKNRKGMTMVEVLISLAVLALLSVPIMVTFMNAQVLARKVDKQTEISSVTRTVKQIVTDGIVTNAVMVNIGNTETRKYRDFVDQKKDKAIDTVSNLEIKENKKTNEKYKFSISYGSSFHDSTNFPDVYNVLITIKEKDSDEKVDELKVAVRVDDL